MFTTINNSALQVSRAISTLLLGLKKWFGDSWDVSKEKLEAHDLDGMVNLTILTTVMQVSGILFVGMLPKTKDELLELRNKSNGSSRVGGFLFLVITFLSIIYAVGIGILNIVKPGWSGES